jgi:hypothetical protein
MSPASALARLSELCLAFLEVLEDPAGVGNHSFKVVGRNFVVHVGNHHSDGRTAVWCHDREGAQLALTTGGPERYFVPPGVGRYG